MCSFLFFILICFSNSTKTMQQPARVYDLVKTDALREILAKCFNTDIFYSNILGDEEEYEIKKLIIEGADPNVVVSGSFYREYTLLEALTSFEKNFGYHVGLFDFLLQNGANTNRMRSEFRRSPLMSACNAGCFGAARRLIEHGANVNHINLLNETCLFDAVRSSFFHAEHFLVQLLLENGAAPGIELISTSSTSRGESAMSLARKQDYAEHYPETRNKIREILDDYRKQKIS